MQIWDYVKNQNEKLRSFIPISKRSKPLTFTFVLLAVCLDNLSVTGNTTTFFSVIEYFNSNSTTASWTLSAYALTLGAFIMLAGKMTDVLGPEVVFVWGIFLTGFFALLCAVITNQIIVLIVFRALQGIFAASLVPSSFAIAGTYFQGKALGNAINALVFALTVSFGIGMVVGGAFSASSVGYKGVHYLTFAFSWTCGIALYFCMYPIERTDEHSKMSLKNLDYPGSFLFVIGIVLVILGMTEGGESWRSPKAYVPLIVGVLVLVGALLFEIIYLQNFKDKVQHLVEKGEIESKSKSEEINETSRVIQTEDWRYKIQMLFPREVFTIPNFLIYVFATVLCYISYFGVVVTMIEYYQYVELNSPILSAVKSLSLSLGLTFGAVINKEELLYKLGMKNCLLFSEILGVAMVVWLSRHDFTTKLSYWKYECFSQFFYGYATNLYFNIYLNAIMRRAPVHLHGVVSGFLQTIGQLGICLSNSLLSSIMGDIEIRQDIAYRRHLSNKFTVMFYVALAGNALSFFALLFVKNQKSFDDDEQKPDDNESEVHS